MKRVSWFIIFACVWTVLFVTCKAHCREPLDARLQKLMPALSTPAGSVDHAELAKAIVEATRSEQWALLLLTVAHHETALSWRIAIGECRSNGECDGGRAWGLYQQHYNTFNSLVWGMPDVRTQTLEASRALNRAYRQCQVRGTPLRIDWVRRTLSAYAGRGCDSPWKGFDARVATFERLARKL